jgi:hypothetical protein
MTSAVESLPDPPGPPDHHGRIRLYRFQRLGLPILAAIPILALLGLFGERWNSVQARDGALDVSVRYPTAFRYKMIDEIEVYVTNRGSGIIDTVTVALDTAYATMFSTINAVPPFTGPFEVSLPQLASGESRRVRIEIQAERYWTHTGELSVRSASDTARVTLETTVFP